MTKKIAILTAGGDCPGLNAAIRGVGKAAEGRYGMQVMGFRDGFRGLAENRTMDLSGASLSDILTVGGTILGTSRDKPNKIMVDGKATDMTETIIKNYHANQLDALVCLGGGGTQKNALWLAQHGLNIITLPKTIDNDVAITDMTFGFDTALGIATEAIDRLHSTAHSHHRIIVVEIMGHRTGWLALGAGIAGGADVILIPEIPYSVNSVADAIKARVRKGKTFSIVAIAEGAVTAWHADEVAKYEAMRQQAEDKEENHRAKKKLAKLKAFHGDHAINLAQELEVLTELESRVTILGHVQRGGTPSAGDRLLASRLGSGCADFIAEGHFGVMVADKAGKTVAVPLEQVAGNRKEVPLDHPWINTARSVGTNLGD